MEIIAALVVGFVVGCLVGANNAKKTKDIANSAKAEASGLADKAKDAAQ